MTATLPGWRREKGTSRGYVNDATGQRISRRQFDKMVSAAGQHKAMSPQRIAIQTRAQRQYNSVLRDYVREQRQSGNPITKKQAMQSAELKRIVRDIGGSEHTKRGQERKKIALTAIGRRQGIPEWVPVGLSDRYRKGKLRKSRIPKSYRF